MLLDQRGELIPRELRADDRVDHLAALEDQQRRDARTMN